MKRWFIFIFTAVLLFGAARLYYRLTDDFRISNMTYQLPFEAPWQVPHLTAKERADLALILDQNFHYIGKGAQCYAFQSDDRQFVLKFFKFKHLKPNLFVDLIPSISPFKSYKRKCIERKKRKLIGVFNGYDLAYRENRIGSELLYVHLVPTNDLNLRVKVFDKIGLEREIDLDRTVFLVQRKGETLRMRMKHLLTARRLEEAEKAIASIVDMYISEYQKGLYDHDHGVMHNTGFVGSKAFHLDVGKLNRDERMREPLYYKKDLEHVLWKIDTWIKAHFPNDYPRFSAFLSGQYQKWTDEILDFQKVDPKRFKKNR